MNPAHETFLRTPLNWTAPVVGGFLANCERNWTAFLYY